MTARENFILNNLNAAKSATFNSGIFPEVLLAQAILESQREINNTYVPGASLLSAKYNNYFGIKAEPGYKGNFITLDTVEFTNQRVKGNFRAYPTKTAGFIDYVKFLRTNPRYTIGGVFNAKTPEAQAAAISNSGYATSPTYKGILMSVLKDVTETIKKKRTINTTYPARVVVY
jgi:flagellum-specific peptidoglycan hydrolase FlgJ